MSSTASLSLVLTPRDVQVLQMVYSYNGVTIDQLKRRFFSHCSSHSFYYQRLARLVNAGYLTTRPVYSFSTVPSSKRLFLLGFQGKAVIADLYNLQPKELKRLTKAAASAVIMHHLAIADVRLSLELAIERLSTVALMEWLTEADLLKQPVIGKLPPNTTNEVEEIINYADAGFSVQLPDNTNRSYLVEIDRSTVPAGRIKQKLLGYLLASANQRSTKPILFVVPDEKRAAFIAQWAAEQATPLKANPAIFAVAKITDLTEQLILTAPVWQVVGIAKPQALLPAAVTEIPSWSESNFEQVTHPTPP